jgi:predicted nucleotidyltransferase
MGEIKNLDKINPIKRNVVSDILSQVKDYEFLDKIIIFGSSIRGDCKETSDLDIAIKWTEECFDDDYILKSFTLPVYKIILKCTNGNDDIIPIGYEGELKKAIEEGVVVYETVYVQ